MVIAAETSIDELLAKLQGADLTEAHLDNDGDIFVPSGGVRFANPTLMRHCFLWSGDTSSDLSETRGSMTLSKSKVLSGIQCEKRLWLEIHRPKLAVEDAESISRKEEGTKFGQFAHREWPNGLLVETKDYARALSETAAWLANPDRPIFEGTFEYRGVRVKADVLVPNDDGTFDLFEVKGSAAVKHPNREDVAVQTWVLEGCGLKLRNLHLTHANNQFIFPGGEDFDGLFTHANITEKVRKDIETVPGIVARLSEVVEGDEPPIAIGRHCKKPNLCSFINYCTANTERPKYFTASLPSGNGMYRKVDALIDAGYTDICKISEDELTEPLHRIVRQAVVTGAPVSDGRAAKKFSGLGWPRYYIDFETVSFTIPHWPGTRPFEHIPFQWSCHIEQIDGTLVHKEFLAEAGALPIRAFATSLIEALGTEGPVLVYTNYEGQRLKGIRPHVPDLVDAVNGIIGRLVDLHDLTVESWYHPDMIGSWSIKKVLPTIPGAGIGYEALEGVADGGAASRGYAELLKPATTEARRVEVESQLRQYCKLDTEAMVRLAAHLRSLR